MFIDLETRLPVGANTHGEIWCQASNILVATESSKSLQSNFDKRRVKEGPLHFSLIDLIIIISKIVYKIQ